MGHCFEVRDGEWRDDLLETQFIISDDQSCLQIKLEVKYSLARSLYEWYFTITSKMVEMFHMTLPTAFPQSGYLEEMILPWIERKRMMISIKNLIMVITISSIISNSLIIKKIDCQFP